MDRTWTGHMKVSGVSGDSSPLCSAASAARAHLLAFPTTSGWFYRMALPLRLTSFHSTLRRHPLVFFFRNFFALSSFVVVVSQKLFSPLEFALWRDMAPPPLKYVPLNFPTFPHHLTYYYTPAFCPPNFRPRCVFYMKWPIIAMASLLMHFSASATATLVQSANSPSFSHPTSFKMAVVIYLEEKRVEHMR